MSVWLPIIVGAAFVWVVFRAGQWNEWQGVIRGLEAELEMHKRWVGTAYSEKDRGKWDADYVVFKLTTVATDNAIVRGPGLFLNKDLTVALVKYRQVVGHVNQLIDKATDFQVVAELWRNPRPPDQEVAAKQLVESVHIAGIGDSTLAEKAAAYVFFKIVMEQLRVEKGSRAARYFWTLTAVDPDFLERWGVWLLVRLRSARRLVDASWRRIERAVFLGRSPSLSNPIGPASEQAPLTTSHESQSFATVEPFEITNVSSANTSSWIEQARLPMKTRETSSSATAEPAARRRRRKQDSDRSRP